MREDERAANRSSRSSSDLLTSSVSNTPKKRRNKPIKSCTFCRQKKLRCDQKRPRCKTCTQRGRKACIYSDLEAAKEMQDLDSDEELKNRVGNLEERLRQIEDNKESITPASKNVLLDLNLFQVKENGKGTMFGPSSTRTFFLNERWGFFTQYSELRKRIKSERNVSKDETGQSIFYENGLTELRYDMEPELKERCTLLSEVLSSLPSYESILKKLDFFFENSELFVINEIFDEVKVRKDFKECFIPGSASPNGNERPIKSLVTMSRNYYKIGVILGILMYVEISYQTPTSFETFFVLLHGMGIGNMNCIERIQVTFLRYSFRAKWGITGSGALHTIALVNSMVNDALIMGLNTNITVTFEDYETLYGNLLSLRKLWLWILFYDVDSALQMGSFLKVPDEVILDETIFEIDKDNVGSLNSLMGVFLKMSRPMLLSVYNKVLTPDLESYCRHIIRFIEDKFPVIGSYADEASIKNIPFHNTIVLSQAISLLLAFYGLRILALKKKNNCLKNALGKATIIAFGLSVKLIERNFKKDKLVFPETLESNFKCLSPYMCLTISFLNRLIVRALSIFYTIFYHKLTLFRNGLSNLSLKDRKLPIDMTSFRVSSVEKLSLLSVFDNLSEIFDRFTNAHDEVFNLITHRSATLLKVFALEGLCRRFMNNILKSGKVIEKAEVLHYQNDIDTVLSNTVGTISVSPPTNLESDSISLRMDEWETIPSLSLVTDTGNITATIEQDFSSSYDVNWEELLGGVDDVDLYYELLNKQ